MVKWFADRSGRFPQRPHYEMEELDRECERLVNAFLRKKHRRAGYPISTEDLTILVEEEVGDLDLYAELDEGVEGVTDFFRGRKPEVRIARELSEDTWRENRLRTTLTHELGHVKFHDFLWFFKQDPLPSPFAAANTGSVIFSPTCKRDSMLETSQTDWLEWQAGYACGAFLMPITALRRSTDEFLDKHGLTELLTLDTPSGQELIRHTIKVFQVSADAARVRLLKRGYLIT